MKEIKLDIPFYLQTTPLNCGPVALKMVLEFLGEEHSIEEIEGLVGIKEGKAVSTIRLAIAARKLGFKVDFYTKVLGMNPENLKLDFYKKHGDVVQREESENLQKEAKSLGVNLFEKTLLQDAIIDNLDEDRAMIVLLDWNKINRKEDFRGHFVPIVGLSKNNILVHNHGFLNTAPYFPIDKSLFESARKAKGTDEDLLIIYRKQ